MTTLMTEENQLKTDLPLLAEASYP